MSTSGRSDELFQFLTSGCGIGDKDARIYASCLEEIGCDGVADLKLVDDDDWPDAMLRKPIHMKKLRNALERSETPLSVSTAVSPSRAVECNDASNTPVTPASPSDATNASHWGISYDQLLGIAADTKRHFGSDYCSKTMFDVVQEVVKPVCRTSGVSYARFLNRSVSKQVQAFVTHTWREKFDDFVMSVQDAFQTWLEKPNLFICAFALYQGEAEDVAAQLDQPIPEAPFVVALRDAKYFVVVRNAEEDLYSRAWCLVEILFAMDFGFVPASTIITGPPTFAGTTTSSMDCQASVKADKIKIMKFLMHRDIHAVDEVISSFRKFEYSSPSRHDAADRLFVDLPSSHDATDRLFVDLLSPPATELVKPSIMRAKPSKKESKCHVPHPPSTEPDSDVPATGESITTSIAAGAANAMAMLQQQFLGADPRCGSKVKRSDGQFQKVPNFEHESKMETHVKSCTHEGCQKVWKGPWGKFIGGHNGKTHFDLTDCPKGKQLNQSTGWNYDDPRF